MTTRCAPHALAERVPSRPATPRDPPPPWRWQAGTLGTEPLALEYVFGEDADEPNTWHFYEKYVGRAGFEAHQATPHFAAWEAFAATGPFTSPPVVKFYQEM